MGLYVGEQKVYAREAGFAVRQAFVAAGSGVGQVEYLGWGEPGALTSEAKWQIRKFFYDSSNRVSYTQFADGNDAYDNIWDNYASLSYS